MTNTWSRLLVALFALTPALALGAVPTTVGFTARIADNGHPVVGTHSVTFKLFDAATEGNLVWEETKDVAVNDGVATAALGDITALDSSVFDGTQRFLEVTFGGAVMSPRIAIHSVPYAVRAGVADRLAAPLECQTQLLSVAVAAGGGATLTPNCAGLGAGWSLTGGGCEFIGPVPYYWRFCTPLGDTMWGSVTASGGAGTMLIRAQCCRTP
jgi:hypothetical protein